MTTSENKPAEAFVWVWLPGATTPVVAGRLYADGDRLLYNYGRSYLARNNAIALYDPELPLQSGAISPLPGLNMPNCIRDAAPDAWGRRVILNRKFGKSAKNIDTDQIDELTYLLESGSDRVGALDFQLSAETRRLVCNLDQIKDGRITKIEIRDGIPRRLVVASRPA